jgi:hypothetical protein
MRDAILTDRFQYQNQFVDIDTTPERDHQQKV